MLAALSLADRHLSDRLIQEAFAQASSTKNGDFNVKESRKAAFVASGIRDKLIATVEACKEMLAKEPPARMTEYWGTVRRPLFIFFSYFTLDFSCAYPLKFPSLLPLSCSSPPPLFCQRQLTGGVSPTQPDSNKIIKPLRQKLRRCHDPDRWDLVALQKTRREQAAARGHDSDDGPGASLEDDAAVFGGGGGVAEGRNAKRRKVGKGPDDPFGGPL